MLRLLLHSTDELKDLNISVDEYAMISKGVEQASQSPGIVDPDPLTLRDALSSHHKDEWIIAMREEMESLKLNDTFDLNDVAPTNTRALSTKWVFRQKLNADDTIRFKARLVVRGFLQREGIDFDQTYAPVATQTSFRLLLALSRKFGWTVRQLDVITAFLHPKVDKEDLWISLPSGTLRYCTTFDASTMRLKKALYGLRQSPRLWWATIDAAFVKMGLTRGQYDTNLYFSKSVIVLLYVDDTLIFDLSGSVKELSSAASLVINNLMSQFQMKDLGTLRRFLGFTVSFDEGQTCISQSGYITTIAARYGMQDSKVTLSPVDEKHQIDSGNVIDNLLDAEGKQRYQSLIGALLYPALGTRADISFAVSALSRHCASPMSSHMTAARRVLRYLVSTKDFQLKYTTASSGLNGMCDADWAANVKDRRSISGYAFFFGKCLIAWKAKRQTMVALSTAEAELIACSESSREATWLRNLLQEIIKHTSIELEDAPVLIHCDNQSALKVIAKGMVNPSGRNKHIDIRHYHARDMVEAGVVNFVYVKSEDNLADILTKGLGVNRHQVMTEKMGIGL